MQSMLALIASTVIGMLTYVSFLRFNSDATRDLYLQTLDNATYEKLDNTVRIIDYDFSRIGLSVNDPSQSIFQMATATEARFVMDSNGDGALENYRYYLSDAATAAITPHPNDRILFRTVNGGTPESIAAGIISLTIRYFDSSGAETAVLNAIRTLTIDIDMESDLNYDGQYVKTLWQGRIAPASLVTQ